MGIWFAVPPLSINFWGVAALLRVAYGGRYIFFPVITEGSFSDVAYMSWHCMMPKQKCDLAQLHRHSWVSTISVVVHRYLKLL